MKLTLLPTKETENSSNTEKDVHYFETVIIGTGFSGLLAAIGLKKKFY